MNINIIQVASSILIVGVLFSGCTHRSPPKTKDMSQLEWRQIQTKSFDTNDEIMALRATLSALQDEGFNISTSNTELGLIVAINTIDSNAGCIVKAGGSTCERSIRTTASATIQKKSKNKTQVRIAIVREGISGTNGVMWSRQVSDTNTYQNIFSKVDKAIFLQKENL